jgi:hypothetical protein
MSELFAIFRLKLFWGFFRLSVASEVTEGTSHGHEFFIVVPGVRLSVAWMLSASCPSCTGNLTLFCFASTVFYSNTAHF